MHKILFNLLFFPALLSSICMEAKPFAYIGNNNTNGTGSVSVIDVATNTVVDTIALETSATPYALAINPNGTTLLTTDFNNSKLITISTRTNEVVATTAAGALPEGVGITPNGRYAYMASTDNDRIYVFDLLNPPLTDSVFFTSGNNPKLFAFSPMGDYVYVTNQGPPATLSVIQTSTNTIVNAIPFTLPAYGVAITPNGKYAYVTHPQSNYVSVVDLASTSVTQTITVGNAPYYIAITPNGKYAYVANEADDTVSMIDLKSNTATNTISVGNGPRGVAITSDGKHVYITNFNANTVSVIHTSTNTVIATVSVGRNPFGLAITPSAAHARLLTGLSTYGLTPFVPLKGVTP